MFEDEDREFHENNRENDYHDDAYDRMNEDDQRTSQEMWEDDGQESVKEDPQRGIRIVGVVRVIRIIRMLRFRMSRFTVQRGCHRLSKGLPGLQFRRFCLV